MATIKKSASLPGKLASPKKGVETKLKKVPKSKPVKYTDKSAGQPELPPIFDKIKKLMKPYEKGTIVSKGENGGIYNLVSEKTFEFMGKIREELYFASIIIQKGYVGFYFMPVYGDTKLKDVIAPELLKCLKGKACFHIKKDDPQIMGQIKDALKVGYEGYKMRGWV